MSHPVEELTPIRVVLRELEEFSKRWEVLVRGERGQFKCRRSRPRRKLCTPCQIWFYTQGGARLVRRQAVTRNISEQGIGLLAKSMVQRGAPMEIRIAIPGSSAMYFGGVAVHCRYTTYGIYEIGVRLETRQDVPVFVDDPRVRALELPWLRQALLAFRGRGPGSGRP